MIEYRGSHSSARNSKLSLTMLCSRTEGEASIIDAQSRKSWHKTHNLFK